MGHVRIAGALVLLGGVFDILDGQVARASGLSSVFGSFYDSTLDRISEIVVFLGIFSLYGGGHPDFEYPWMVYTVALAMAGSLMVSYTRARAEALGLDCNVGLMQRPERVVLIGVSSLLFGGAWNGAVLTWVLLLMATLTNFTAVPAHRLGIPPHGAHGGRRARPRAAGRPTRNLPRRNQVVTHLQNTAAAGHGTPRNPAPRPRRRVHHGDRRRGARASRAGAPDRQPHADGNDPPGQAHRGSLARASRSFAPLTGLDDIVFGAWDPISDDAYDSALARRRARPARAHRADRATS